MNPKHFERVIKVMSDEPLRVNMETWSCTNPDILRRYYDQEPKCSTIGCIAGWAVMINSKGKINKKKLTVSVFDFEEDGAKALGISAAQAQSLFYPEWWPAKFQGALSHTTSGTKAYVDVVIARMRHMMKTGK